MINRQGRLSSIARPMTFIFLSVATAIGCGWMMMTDHSVRFNSFRTGRAFYRLPPLPLMYDRETGREISAFEWESEDLPEETYEEREKRTQQLIENRDAIWQTGHDAIRNGDLNTARTSLTEYLKITEIPSPYAQQEDEIQPRRNSAADMMAAMSALNQGATRHAVKAYLSARQTYDEDPTTINFDEVRPDKNLRDNWAYLRAAAAYKSGDKERAIAEFRDHALKYPRSEKNEAALYMAAKILMESSHSFGNMGCGIQGKREVWGDDEPLDPGKIEPVEKCRDENWGLAIDAFKQFMRKHPNGEYVDDARGWLAYLYRRGGERAQSLAEYYRLLGHPNKRSVRLEAKKSLQMIGHEYDDETLDAVEKLIADDVNASMAYAYHRIYNHAVDFTTAKVDRWCCWGENRWQQMQEEEKRVADAHATGNYELERVARFATGMMKRYPNARVTGGFVLRVAEAQLELQNFPEALRLSDKALNMGVEDPMRMEALWIKGSSEHQLKKLSSAGVTLRQLVSEFPKSKLTEAARRLLAMTAEDEDDLETALEIYIDLKYDTDVAYFVDVLFPTDRLAKFIHARKNIPQYNQLLYGLGVRYMRDRRWNDARKILSSVRTESGIDGYLEHDKNATWYFPKEPSSDYGEFSYIKTSWVMQDLKTIDILDHYEQAAESAQGDENKAEAMYQLASALFESDDLVFYNPSAWKGLRSGNLAELQFSDHLRSPNESRIIFDHLQAHDPWARAIPIYEEIVARFPQTKVARDAMYSAAVAHERLSSRNGPWTVNYERGLFPGPRIVTYADVRSAYPDYQLPRGTYGWEPSTRTVNGGPGWAAPEKPKPRETREQKIKRLLKEFKTELKTSVSSIATKLSSTIEPKVQSGLSWYGSMIEAAIYGIVSGIGLWALILIGIKLHLRKLIPDAVVMGETGPMKAESRVDKMIE